MSRPEKYARFGRVDVTIGAGITGGVPEKAESIEAKPSWWVFSPPATAAAPKVEERKGNFSLMLPAHPPLCPPPALILAAPGPAMARIRLFLRRRPRNASKASRAKMMGIATAAPSAPWERGSEAVCA